MLSAFLFSATEVASSTIFDQWWLGMKDQAMAGQLNFWQNIYKEIYQNVLYNDRWLNYLRGMAEMASEKGILFHTDAVQAVGKTPIDLAHLPASMHAFGHGAQGPGLLERLAAGQCDARQQRIFAHLVKGGLRRKRKAALKTVRLRVVAPFAMVRAPLREQHIPKPRPVHYGFLHNARQPHGKAALLRLTAAGPLPIFTGIPY